jgi:hypothetical protein
MQAGFLDQLRSVAEAKEREESDYRLESRRRLEGLAAERTQAYRRYNLLKDMAGAAAGVVELPAGVDVQLAVATSESGWNGERAGYAELREQLSPVASLIHAQLHPQTEASAASPVERDVAEAFAAFEAWYRGRFGQDFLDLLGREPPSFQPLVDF